MECFPRRLHENPSRNPHKLRSRGLEPATARERAQSPAADISLTAAAWDRPGLGVTGPGLGQVRVGSGVEMYPLRRRSFPVIGFFSLREWHSHRAKSAHRGKPPRKPISLRRILPRKHERSLDHDG
jgi:hypothetical protein